MTTPMQIIDGKFSRPFVESDVHRGELNGPNGSHCTNGWSNFVYHVDRSMSLVWDGLLTNHARVAGFTYTSEWNDSPSTTTTEIVSVLNRTAREAGLLAEDTPCT